MNELDTYIMECFKNDKKIGGVKIKNLSNLKREYSDVELFSMAKQLKIPLCKICGGKVSLTKKRYFTTFCGMECQKKYLSRENKIKNSELNKEKSKKKKDERIGLIEEASNFYINSNHSISEVAKRFDIPKHSLRTHLSENSLIDNQRQYKTFKHNIETNFKCINDKLSDIDSLEKYKSLNFTHKDISQDLGCSPDYVSVFFRKNNTNYPKSNESSFERKIKTILEQYDINYISNDRCVLNGKELDIFIPEKNLAIEINGSYWHQTGIGFKDKNYHLNKTVECEKAGIRLIHLSDYEILHKIPHIKSIILDAIGKSKKMHSRNCEICVIDDKTFISFCDNNHIQGSIFSKYKYGLYTKNKLVAVMGISNPNSSVKYDFELTRYCSLNGIHVIGGSSKLINKFIGDFGNCSVISYCNRNYFTGNDHLKIGMTYKGNTIPDYFWVKNDLSIVKPKHHYEDMSEQGYYKIHDSGQKIFTIERNNGY